MIKSRVFGNSAANAAGIAWSAALQVLTVPILAGTWGANRYGEWLLLSTIPTYLALSDLGFAAAATSDMTMAISRGDRTSALRTFHSVWSLIIIIGGLVLLLASPLPILSYFEDLKPYWWPKEAITLYLLLTYSTLVLASRVVLAGFRSSGHYASGTLVYDAMVFAEGFMLLPIAYMSKSFACSALSLVTFRAVIIALQMLRLRRLLPWLALGHSAADPNELRRLLAPAFAAMAVPTALAINIQGMMLVTGAILSPGAVAILSATRTASRIAIQLAGIINRGTMPEFGIAFGVRDFARLRSLTRLNIWVGLGTLIPGALVFAILGKYLVETWTHGAVHPTSSFIVLMAAGMAIQGLWTIACNLLLAINEHVLFSRVLLCTSLIAIVIAIPLGRNFGLNGIAIATITSDGIALVALAINAMSLLRHRSRTEACKI
jgi:O-antigen/teichoic acid export membrane protein